jgi:hypothetical protein
MSPNVCSSKLVITGPLTELREFRKKVKGHAPRYADDPKSVEMPEEELCFHQMVPVPASLLAQDHDEPAANSLSNCGKEWEYETWGCYCGARNVTAQLTPSAPVPFLAYDFETFWDPPKQLILTVSRWCPDLIFEIRYVGVWDECLAGVFIVMDGKALIDHRWHADPQCLPESWGLMMISGSGHEEAKEAPKLDGMPDAKGKTTAPPYSDESA